MVLRLGLGGGRGGGAVAVVCTEFRSFGSVQERSGGSRGHLRMRVSLKWSIRLFGRVGKQKKIENGSKPEIYPYLFYHHYGFQQP